MGNKNLSDELKKMFELIGPSLRNAMRPGVTGKVIAVNDDAFTVDVQVDDVPESSDQAPGDPWIMPKVPVSSAAAGDGGGLFVMPEVGAEVTVSFKDFDVTQPRVDGAEFLNNRTPIGGRVGSFTMADNSGQRVTLRPDTGELVFRVYNVDDQSLGARTEVTGRNKRVSVAGNLDQTVSGAVVRKTGQGVTEEITDGEYHRISPNAEEHTEYFEQVGDKSKMYQHALLVNGSDKLKVSGKRDEQISGDRNVKVLGDDYEAVAKSKNVVVGGKITLMAAGVSPGGAPDPVCMEIGGPSIVNIGGPYIAGLSAPLINGLVFLPAFTAFLTALGGPILGATPPGGGSVTPNLALVTAIETLRKLLVDMISKRIYMSGV